MKTWVRGAGLSLMLLGVGCGQNELQRNEPVQQEARLERFEGCESLERYVKDTAVRQMKSSLEAMKPSYWRSRGGGWWMPPSMGDSADGPVAAPAPGAPGAGNGGSPSRPGDYTDTNNQVQGVDEADFVKTDGTRLFVLSGQRLQLLRSWPAQELRLESTLAVEGWPREMYLEGNRVVIFSGVNLTRAGQPGGSSGGSGDMALCPPGRMCGWGSGGTKVTVVDVADLRAPRVVDELYLHGNYQTARKVGSAARLVMSDTVYWPPEVRWWVTYSEDLYKDEARYERALDELMASNERFIRDWPLERWLPESWRKRADGSKEPLPQDCRDFHRTNAPTQLGFVTVASLELGQAGVQGAPGFIRLVAQPNVVYSSAESMYLATTHWWWWPEPGQSDHTYLHKLDIRDPRQARYLASGTVEGHLLNQFSMDEHQGVLRAAVTLTRRVKDPNQPDNIWGTLQTTSQVVTLGQEGDRLQVLGRSEELAPTERIFSARFVGEKGYVVTFRQVDPLFTFDLSDPARPRKLGELKVPGFSTYIHPLEDGWLLTLGVDLPENGDWQQRALKLTLFDVRDMSQPREAFTQLVGTAYGWSEAQYEHKAFNYFAARGLLAIPFADWRYDSRDPWYGFISELRVFRVSTSTGFTPVGAVSMRDVYQAVGARPYGGYWAPHVRRSVMADDYVYAITDAGVRVARSDSPGTPVATTYFPPSTP